jgi:predicted GNAT family N-acyltransferase
MSFAVRDALDEGEVAEAIELRRRVFCDEQGVPLAEEMDGRDDGAIHLVAVDGDGVIGTCRLLVVGRTVQLSRLAVDAQARRRGIARALLRASEARARSAGARRIVLHAQTYARALYADDGFEERGGVFWEAGIEHVAMEKPLA